MPNIFVEYVWVDGQEPTKKLRSKTKVLEKGAEVPEWSFDGSSTNQAEGRFSDCILRPVRLAPDPVRGEPNLLALCEVFNSDNIPHSSNTRARLVESAERFKRYDPLFGIEQEYTLFDADGSHPYRWPERKTAFPGPQGPYYCGVGSDEVYGRELVEAHAKACIYAGIKIAGINAEVMPAQWEFQIGPLDPLAAADQVWLARWLLYRMGENFGISAKLDPKPIEGDWNGAGAHTNFSTKEMREDGGIRFIQEACEKLGRFHKEHIDVYGAGNAKRLTGKHETCDINTFRWGVADRGSSIRIPLLVERAGKGYFEDRRPAANMDPYEVCTALLETVCGEGVKP